MAMCLRSNPLFCIIPPYLLREIAANGTPLQQQHAQQNLANSWQIRELRAAITGAETVIADADAVTLLRERLVYDAQHGSMLPGVLVRGENDPPTDDIAVNEAFDGAGATYDLFRSAYGRNSIDDRGMRIESSVHYRIGYDNAFWNGRQMVYGDGDEDLPEEQRLFNRFTIAVDVIAHELTHGVSQFEAGLLYQGQPGALNESISDVFGALVAQYQLGQSTREADWIIGKGLFTSNVNGVGVRSLREPGTAYDDPIIGKDPQPGHMRDYVYTIEDSGGVHINSGIPNRAFYVTAAELDGYAWEKAGRIWYVTLCDRLTGASDFQAMANLTYAVAGELYGKGSIEQQAVGTGWAEVGILAAEENGGEPSPTPGTGSEQPGCIPSLFALARHWPWAKNNV